MWIRNDSSYVESDLLCLSQLPSDSVGDLQYSFQCLQVRDTITLLFTLLISPCRSSDSDICSVYADPVASIKIQLKRPWQKC